MCEQTRAQAEGASADPVELEAALQQLKLAHMEQRLAAGTPTEKAPAVPQVHPSHTVRVNKLLTSTPSGNHFHM